MKKSDASDRVKKKSAFDEEPIANSNPDRAYRDQLSDLVRGIINKGSTTVSSTEENVTRLVSDLLGSRYAPSVIAGWLNSLSTETKTELATLIARELVKLPLQLKLDELLLQVLAKMQIRVTFEFELRKDKIEDGRKNETASKQQRQRIAEQEKFRAAIMTLLKKKSDGLPAASIAKQLGTTTQRVVYHLGDMLEEGSVAQTGKRYRMKQKETAP